MSDRVRHKGRFIKKKVLAQRLNASSRGKKIKKSVINTDDTVQNPCEGRRIVELGELGKNLKCSNCKQVLSLDRIVKEKRMGLHSILTVLCETCSVTTLVPTGKIHACKDKLKHHSDVNTKAVLGTLHAGVGCTALNKLLACLNIPTVSPALFKRYEREIGPAIEEAAKDSCKRAAEEERKLVITNIDKLCQELPKEIIDDIYPHLTHLRLTASDANNSAESENATNFDGALGNVVNIIVSYDMGWSRRGNGRSYDSLNGYGTIIGFLSGKVLDFATRNRKCKLCDSGRDKNSHDCRKNFRGSAKAMEPDVGAELVTRSSILRDANVNVRVLVGDEDSSTIAAVRRENSQTIYKLADTNHIKKHFTNDLYELKKTFKEMGKKETIPHLKKCFGYAVAQNKGKTQELAATLRNIPDHLFGRHENCGNWCQRSLNSKPQKVLLKDPSLFLKLKEVFSKFSVAASSQANESLNNIMAHKAPKNRCYSLSESADFRLASAVCTKNDGERHLLTVGEKLKISPGKHTNSYALKIDTMKSQRAAKQKLPATKCRRNILLRERESLRKKTEQSEGIQYVPNCGLNLSEEIDNNNINLDNRFENIEVSSNNCRIVYFDLETSGFSKTADILQIAAKSAEYCFSIYVNPTQDITYGATTVTGLQNIAGELFLRGKKLNSVPIYEALYLFLKYLQNFEICLLVAHNAKFDTSHLIRCIRKNMMTNEFKNIIVGFSDTINILKKKLPDRKGPGKFKLSTLTHDLLKIDAGNLHDASYDVEILEKLSVNQISANDFFESYLTFQEAVNNEVRSEKALALSQTLAVFSGALSKGMLKKMANTGISFNLLKSTYVQNGKQGVYKLLSDNVMGKPRVTKKKSIIEKVVECLIKSG